MFPLYRVAMRHDSLYQFPVHNVHLRLSLKIQPHVPMQELPFLVQMLHHVIRLMLRLFQMRLFRY